MEKQRKIEEAKRLAEEEARQKMEKELVSKKYRSSKAKCKILKKSIGKINNFLTNLTLSVAHTVD